MESDGDSLPSFRVFISKETRRMYMVTSLSAVSDVLPMLEADGWKIDTEWDNVPFGMLVYKRSF